MRVKCPRSASWPAFLGLSLMACASPAFSEDRPPLLNTNVPDGFTLAAGGDLLLASPSPISPRTAPLVNAIRAADVAVANMEGTIVDLAADLVSPNSSGRFLTNSTPDSAKYLSDFGFDMLGFANNHTMNFGTEGARKTVRRLAEEGIATAGFGNTRSAARQPAYLITPKARVGLVSFTSTYFPGTVAADPVGVVPGAPGVSALRNTRIHVVSSDQFQVLRQIDRELNPGAVFQAPPTGDTLTFRGLVFRSGPAPSLDYQVDKADRAEILRAVRTGKQQSDFVIATMHHHEEPNCEDQVRSGPGTAWRCRVPADFVREIARAAIDNGADAFVGHGPHTLLGIEIYKGRPIYYSLGNTFNEVGSMSLIRDAYPSSMDPSKDTDPEYFERMWAFYEQDTEMYESVVATARYTANRLSEVRLIPIDLGINRRQANRGTPEVASHDVAQRILKRLQALSAPMGTAIRIEGDVGIIRIP